MRRIHQLITCYLALCLGVGGAVAFSPVLHRLIEHGGQGPAHTHASVPPSAVTAESPHEHGDGHWHDHAPVRAHSTGLFVHRSKPQGAPSLPLSRLWLGITHLLETAASPDPSPSSDPASHEHHSLFQLFAGGMVDQPVDVPILPPRPTAPCAREICSSTVLVAHDWEAQTASRGPPAS